MKVTKDYLKQVIKEEMEKMEEVDVPLSDTAVQDTYTGGHHRQGPKAAGDETYSALYNTRLFLEHLLKKEEFNKIGGGYLADKARNLLNVVEGAFEGYSRATARMNK